MSYKYLVKMANYYEKNNNLKKAQMIDEALELLAKEQLEDKTKFFSDFFNGIYVQLYMSTKNLFDNYIETMDDMISVISHKYDLDSFGQPKDISEMSDSIKSILSSMKDDSSEEAMYLKETLNIIKTSIEDYKRIF